MFILFSFKPTYKSDDGSEQKELMHFKWAFSEFRVYIKAHVSLLNTKFLNKLFEKFKWTNFRYIYTNYVT